MTQVTDWDVDNAGGAAVRSQMNGILAALRSCSSGASAPSPTVAGMFWFDTTTLTLKVRNNANSAWISLSPETVAANTIRGNGSGSPAAIADITMATLRTMLGFAQTAASPGNLLFPGGMMWQFGATGSISAGGGTTVTLPQAFPNNHWVTILSPNTSANNTSVFSVGARALTLTNFIATNNSGTSGAVSAAYISIGN